MLLDPPFELVPQEGGAKIICKVDRVEAEHVDPQAFDEKANELSELVLRGQMSQLRADQMLMETSITLRCPVCHRYGTYLP